MKPIALEPADFWLLKARSEETQRVLLEAQRAVEAAQGKQQAAWAELAKKYGFAPVLVPFTIDEDGLTLALVDESHG
ncbi:MAG: hypothetical protein NUW01_12230 [Gemmatimonadaceae bacterium]|nr:hypothetical protein [Gemmatimonadaceae bacterium]